MEPGRTNTDWPGSIEERHKHRDPGAQIIDLATGSVLAHRRQPRRPRRTAMIAGAILAAALVALLVWSFAFPGAPQPRGAEDAVREKGTATRLTLPDTRTADFDPAADIREANPDAVLPPTASLAPPAPSPVLSVDPGASAPAPDFDTQPDPRPVQNRHASPALVFDGGGGPGGAVMVGDGAAPIGGTAGIESTRITNAAGASGSSASPRKDATMARGTLVPAVLETAIDSETPGFVRAIVSTDVRSFDGKRILIPRSSRLIGQYRASESAGDRRAYVIWTRIVPPSGAATALSVAGGKDDFMARFDKAKLLSIVGGQPVSQSKKAPRIRVRQGEPIRVFTARDIAF